MNLILMKIEISKKNDTSINSYLQGLNDKNITNISDTIKIRNDFEREILNYKNNYNLKEMASTSIAYFSKNGDYKKNVLIMENNINSSKNSEHEVVYFFDDFFNEDKILENLKIIKNKINSIKKIKIEWPDQISVYNLGKYELNGTIYYMNTFSLKKLMVEKWNYLITVYVLIFVIIYIIFNDDCGVLKSIFIGILIPAIISFVTDLIINKLKITFYKAIDNKEIERGVTKKQNKRDEKINEKYNSEDGIKGISDSKN